MSPRNYLFLMSLQAFFFLWSHFVFLCFSSIFASSIFSRLDFSIRRHILRCCCQLLTRVPLAHFIVRHNAQIVQMITVFDSFILLGKGQNVSVLDIARLFFFIVDWAKCECVGCHQMGQNVSVLDVAGSFFSLTIG